MTVEALTAAIKRAAERVHPAHAPFIAAGYSGPGWLLIDGELNLKYVIEELEQENTP